MLRFLVLILLFTGCGGIKKVSLDKIEREKSHFYVKWSKNLDPIYNAGNLPIGTASPFIHEDILYQGNLNGEMAAYDLETGKTIWSFKEDQPINSKVSLFQEFIVYATMSGRVYSRHYLTGKLNYAVDLGEPVESEIVVHQGRMYAHLRNHKIVAMDAATGKVFWGYRRSVPYTTTLQRVSKVLPFNNKLIVGFADGNLVALNKDEGVVDWEQKLSSGVKFIDVDTEPVYFNGHVVASPAIGNMRFVNPDNGLIVKSIDITAAHAPVKHDDELIVGSVFGEVARIDKDGKILIKRKISNAGISSIAAWANGFAVASMSGQIYQLDPKSLEIIETFELGSDQSAVFGYLQQSNGHLAVYSSRNRLYVFKFL